MQAFITNLGKYTEGELIGEWIELPIDEDDLNETLKDIGCYYVDEEGNEHNKQYEEYFFTDYDDIIEGLDLGEYESIERLNEIAELLEDVDGEKLKAIIEGHTNDINEALELAGDDDVIFYEGQTLEDVAYSIMDEIYGINQKNDIFSRYFDYEAFARDLSFDGFIETSCGVLEIR